LQFALQITLCFTGGENQRVNNEAFSPRLLYYEIVYNLPEQKSRKKINIFKKTVIKPQKPFIKVKTHSPAYISLSASGKLTKKPGFSTKKCVRNSKKEHPKAFFSVYDNTAATISKHPHQFSLKKTNKWYWEHPYS